MVSTSVVPTENGGSIPPRTCGRDADHRRWHSKSLRSNTTDVWGRGLRNLAQYIIDCVRAAISPADFNINPCIGLMQVCLLCLEIRHADSSVSVDG